MRNTKLIVAMLAGCMAVSGAVLAQDASKASSPTPASTAGTPMHTTQDSMKHSGGDSMKQTGADGMSQDPASKSMNSSDSMKSTHKKHKMHEMKKDGSMSEPAKSSTAGM